jgi:hypothetical protein
MSQRLADVPGRREVMHRLVAEVLRGDTPGELRRVLHTAVCDRSAAGGAE